MFYRAVVAAFLVFLLLAMFLCSFHPMNAVKAHYLGASIDCAPLSITPDIDGVYSIGEYSDADLELLTDPFSGMTRYGYFKNDADFLYFLIEVPSSSPYGQDSFLAMSFDTGDDLAYTVDHDDAFKIDPDGTTYHSVSDGTTTPLPGGAFQADYTLHCSPFNPSLPNHDELEAATGFGTSPDDPIQTHRMYEFRIPLVLLQASAGETVGFALDGINRDGMTNGWQWPVHQEAGGSRPLENYGNIVLAPYESVSDWAHDAIGTVRWLGPHVVCQIKASRNLDPDSLQIIMGPLTEIRGELEDPRQEGWLLVGLMTSPQEYEYCAVTFQPHARADFWPMAGHDPTHNGRSVSTVPPNNSTRWNCTAAGAIAFSPSVADEMVFLGSPTEMRALNATTGNLIWQFTRAVTSSPAVANGRVFFGASDGLYALNETTGTSVWRFSTAAPVNSSPIVTAGMVIFGCDNNYVYALNETNKSVIWSFLADGPVRTSPSNPPHALADPRPTPVIFGTATTMYAVNMTTGTLVWSQARAVRSSSAYADGRVFFGSDTGLYALNITDGTPIWRFATGAPVYSCPAVDNGMVFFGSGDLHLYALNATDKSLIWSVPTEETILAPIIAAQGFIVYGQPYTKGDIRSQENGALQWSYGTSAGIVASPVIAYGNLFLGDVNGKLYCIGPEYNVAAISLQPTKTVVGEKGNVYLNATVRNLGEVTETFHVGIECEEGMIGETPVTLAPSESTIVTFRWNATYMSMGNYTLRAVLDTVPGETNGTDNTVSGGWIVVTIPGDAKGDGTVNVLDLILIANHLGHVNGGSHTRYSKQWYECNNCDVKSDGTINVLDLIVTANHLGQHWP